MPIYQFECSEETLSEIKDAILTDIDDMEHDGSSDFVPVIKALEAVEFTDVTPAERKGGFLRAALHGIGDGLGDD